MAELAVSRAEAERRIQDRIAKGDALLQSTIKSQADLDEARAAYYTWNEYNVELLKKLFKTDEEAKDYAHVGPMVWGGTTTLTEEIEDHHDDIRSKLRRLTSLLERLELLDEPGATVSTPDSQEQIARRLIETLDAIKAHGFQNRALIQEAKNLNARLAPTFASMYGGVPEITTTYPTHVWWPRAREHAEQALATASAGQMTAPSSPQVSVPSDRIFVVHGHDHGLEEAVARLIDRLGYKPVILHERPDRGQTIIEKFEREAPDAAFAVVLLTPDDEGRLRALGGVESGVLAPRARQNVVWEFGYFTALLGRGNVVALVVSHGDLERPTDLDGVLYVPVRDIDDLNWRTKLAREMRAAGLDIDMNKVE